MSDDRPEWDEQFGKRLVGSVVLVGITRVSRSGETQEQFFGTVEEADESGVQLRLGGARSGDSYRLPPDPRAFTPADPGTYRLRQTGEELENSDYTTTWTIESGED